MNFTLMTTLFIGANLDFFLILIFLLQKYKFKDTFWGYSLGVALLYVLSAIAGQTIQAFVPEWIIGVLGFIPIWFGIKSGEEETADTANKPIHKALFIVFFIYVASCGADNLALYIPVLSTLTLTDCIIGGIYFIILAFLTNILAYYTSKIRFIERLFNRYGEILTRLIYIAIGLVVIYDTNFLTKLYQLIIS